MNSPQTLPPQKVWTVSNVITVIRILLVPVFIAVLLAPWPEWFGLADMVSNDHKRYLAAAVFVLISATDWLDGYLARSRNEVTDFGKFMDPLADKILVSAALICLVELDTLPSWVVLIILTREFIVSGVRMMAATKGVVIAASMIGKFKTVFQMIAIVMFTLKDTHMVGAPNEALSDAFWCLSWIVMLIALGLTIASLVYYLMEAREILGFKPKNSVKTAATDTTCTSEVLNTSKLTHEELLQLVDSLAHSVVEKACTNHATISCAESLTGGMIGQSITNVPGSSAVFPGGVMSYAERIKCSVLDVPSVVLNTDGAVSEQTAIAMAEGVRKLMASDIAVSATGIAGPTGEEPGKPVGTVWIGLSTSNHAEATLSVFKGNRDEVRLQATALALEMILKAL